MRAGNRSVSCNLFRFSTLLKSLDDSSLFSFVASNSRGLWLSGAGQRYRRRFVRWLAVSLHTVELGVSPLVVRWMSDGCPMDVRMMGTLLSTRVKRLFSTGNLLGNQSSFVVANLAG